MLQLKLMGIDHLLINHPSETWHDGDGDAALAVEGAEAKGGEDALSEYLEACRIWDTKPASRSTIAISPLPTPIGNPNWRLSSPTVLRLRRD